MDFWISTNDCSHHVASDTPIFSSVRLLQLIFWKGTVSRRLLWPAAKPLGGWGLQMSEARGTSLPGLLYL